MWLAASITLGMCSKMCPADGTGCVQGVDVTSNTSKQKKNLNSDFCSFLLSLGFCSVSEIKFLIIKASLHKIRNAIYPANNSKHFVLAGENAW
jgi:hypothetical protein